jgi:hypothetical protein
LERSDTRVPAAASCELAGTKRMGEREGVRLRDAQEPVFHDPLVHFGFVQVNLHLFGGSLPPEQILKYTMVGGSISEIQGRWGPDGSPGIPAKQPKYLILHTCVLREVTHLSTSKYTSIHGSKFGQLFHTMIKDDQRSSKISVQRRRCCHQDKDVERHS